MKEQQKANEKSLKSKQPPTGFDSNFTSPSKQAGKSSQSKIPEKSAITPPKKQQTSKTSIAYTIINKKFVVHPGKAVQSLSADRKGTSSLRSSAYGTGFLRKSTRLAQKHAGGPITIDNDSYNNDEGGASQEDDPVGGQ